MMVIAGLAEAEEVGSFELINNPDREKTIEEEVEGFRDATEAAMAAVEHAPRSYRINAILAYRHMQEEARRHREAEQHGRASGFD